jgi:outer membrane protein assembly factor BamD (BamD/ComL family)
VSPNATNAAAHDSNSLAQEIARIDAIRRDLTANRVKPAIAALQNYQRDFPSGVLHQEAELLNIEAHRQAGDRRRARTLASRFLANNPDSPHSARVRDLLQDLGPDAR